MAPADGHGNPVGPVEPDPTVEARLAAVERTLAELVDVVTGLTSVAVELSAGVDRVGALVARVEAGGLAGILRGKKGKPDA